MIRNSMKPAAAGGSRFRRTIVLGAAAMAYMMLPAVCAAQTPTYTISTAVGYTDGTTTYRGYADDVDASLAQMSVPFAITIDSSHNLYISDELNQQIRKLTASTNIIKMVAGDVYRTAGFYKTDTIANKAPIHNPLGLALDSNGNIYFADSANNLIRVVTPGNVISTAVGDPDLGAGFAGDGNYASTAQLQNPMGVAFDAAGNLYIADTGNNRVRKVTASTGIITTVAGITYSNGPLYLGDGGGADAARLNSPQGIALDAAGNLYIADTGNHCVRKVTASTGIITTIAGIGGPTTGGYNGDNGPATSLQLQYPVGLAVDAGGNLFIADKANNRIRRVAASNGIMTTVAGIGSADFSGNGGPATSAEIATPTGLAIDTTGVIYICDSGNNLIRKLTPNAVTSTVVPSINTGGVIGASEFGGFTSVAPGSWIEIYGSNLAGTTRPWATSDFNKLYAPTSLDGTLVTIGGVPAYVGYVSPTQVNVQVPDLSSALGTQWLTVTNSAGTGSAYTVNVTATQPGLLAPAKFKVGGTPYVEAMSSDFASYMLPTGAISGLTSRPAKPGEIIVIFGVGFGSVSPATIPIAGKTVQQTNSLTTAVQFYLGGIAATTKYAGLAPGSIGLYQFNVVVPSSVSSGDAVPLTFTLGGVAGAQTLYLPVSN